MNLRYEIDQEDFRPRLIIWQLNHESDGRETDRFSHVREATLTAGEGMLVLESIARLAKPIIVLSGSHLLLRDDLFGLVEYGHALGLKMIIETSPEHITQEAIRLYSRFGPRIFRILLDNCVQEDVDTRFRKTPEYYALERCIRLLKSGGFEIHLGVTVQKPGIRELAYEHDYAFRRSARGLYCHLNFDRSKLSKTKQNAYSEDQIEEFIEAIAKMKRYSPDNMYFSPQCVQYGFVGFGESSFEEEGHTEKEKAFEWKHLCLGGKRFAYITATGRVQMCSGLTTEAGDLRMTGFDFQEIWESSQVFRDQRENGKTCTITREHVQREFPADTQLENHLDIEYLP